MATNRKATRQRIHSRIRKKVSGTAERPRLAVHFSGRHVYAQVIDDDAGKTLAAVSTLQKDLAGKKAAANRESAERVGKAIAERLLAKKVENVVFDRGGYIFHGKVKALADAMRPVNLNPDDGRKALAEMSAAGAEIVGSQTKAAGGGE